MNLKRFMAACLCFCLFPICITFAENSVSAPIEAEEIKLNVEFPSTKMYKSIKQNFQKLDLRQYCNRSFTDDVEGDHQGGWSDQGTNDFRTYEHRGAVEYLDIPFDVIEPNDNNNKSVIVLQGQNDPGLTNSVEIPLNGSKASGMYFLHNNAWSSFDYVGTYTINYTDGSSAYIDLINKVHIFDFWGATENNYCRTVWTGSSEATSTISLRLFALNNPYPEKPMKSLTLSTKGSEAYIMVLAITLTDNGPFLPSIDNTSLINPSTVSWSEYEGIDEKVLKGSPLDMSKYLDGPTGIHGKLGTDGEKFVFEDGTNVKFWGTTLVGDSCFPNKEVAHRLSESIAQCGYNIVKLSEFDGADGIFESDGVILDKNKLDKLSYLISCFEEKGIYVYLTLSSSRNINENVNALDNTDIAPGYKLKGFFDEELIDAQKDFIKQFLSYVSPYTNSRIGDSSSLVMIEFADSNTMFEYTSGYSDFSIKSEKYRQLLREKFNEYLKTRYENTRELKKAWNCDYDLADYEKLEDGTIELKSVWRDFFYSANHIRDIQMFFAKLQYDYYISMQDTLREMNIDVLTTCNSNVIGRIDMADSYINSKADFLSRKVSWPVPTTKNKLLAEPMTLNHYSSAISDEYCGFFCELAKNRILGTPYIVSAWSVLETNPYMAEMPIIMAAIAAQQGWHPIQYSFVQDNFCFDSNIINDFYSSYDHPIRMAMMPASATLYYTMPENSHEYKINYSPDEVMSFNNLHDYTKKELISKLNIANKPNRYVFFYDQFKGIRNYQLIGSKSGINITDKDNPERISMTGNYKIVENENIHWDIQNGEFKVEDSFVQSFSGKINSQINLTNLSFEISNENATVSLISLDDNPIKGSGRMLLSTIGRAKNTDMNSIEIKLAAIDEAPKINGMISDVGHGPIMVEPILGEFNLKLKGDYEVYALNSSGERKSRITLTKTKDGYSKFQITKTNASQHYEIIYK